ncbi:MAG: hypothetical protein V3S01_00865 [Dehalococcoidia bacterium]
MTCNYRDCQRPRVKGHTTCKRHHSAGMNAKAQERLRRQRAKRDAINTLIALGIDPRGKVRP